MICREIYQSVLIQKTSCIFRNVVLGDENFVVIANRYKPTIKHPMHCSGESEPVSNRVGALRGHWLDVRGLNLGPTSPIYQSQPGNRTSIRVGGSNIRAEERRVGKECRL